MNYKSMIITALFAILFQTINCEAEDNVKDTINLPSSFTEVSFSYGKKFIPAHNALLDNFKIDGNNFYGFTWAENVLFFNDTYIRTDVGFAFGNIFGNTAFSLYLRPEILIGGLSLITFSFGSGPCFLTLKDQSVNLGGFGISSILACNINIFQKLGLKIGYQFENYPKSNYNTFILGINYRIK